VVPLPSQMVLEQVANPVSSPVTVEQGGTGQISYSDGELLIGNSNPIIKLSKSTLTGTINQINVTNSAGSITLSTPQDIETTSTPEFVGVNLETSGGIQTTLNYYEEYTHTTDWNCLAWSTSPQSGNVQITRVGKKITLSCPLLIFTTGGGTSNGEIQMSIVLPERFRPSSTTYQIVHIINVALYGSGVAQVSLTGTINVYSNVSLGTFTNVAGNGGFSGFSITYTL